MSVSLSFPADVHRELLTHLGSTEDEQVAFLFTHPPTAGEPLRVAELYRVPPEAFDFQSAFHVTLSDEIRGQVIGRAWRLGGCLVEVHSHEGGPPAAFSGSDLAGFEEWVPHVRWRLRGRTYVALVFANESFDALVWEEGSDAPGRLAGVIVDFTDAVLTPTDITYRRLSEARRGP
jgi:hypothetical protein